MVNVSCFEHQQGERAPAKDTAGDDSVQQDTERH